MIGDNLPSVISNEDDARAFAAAISALRAEADCIEATYKPHLDVLKADADTYRAERNDKTATLRAQETALREVLSVWLAGDLDGNLRDGERIVATLARKACKPQIHADQLPPEYLSMQPNVGAINAALARGEKVPGVVVKVETSLRVL